MLIFVALIKRKEVDYENQTHQHVGTERGVLTEVEQSSGF